MADTLAGQSTVGQEEPRRYTTPPGNAQQLFETNRVAPSTCALSSQSRSVQPSRGLDRPCPCEFGYCQDARCATEVERIPNSTPDNRIARRSSLAAGESLVITHPDRIN
jgi:hypothetical protein